MFNYELLITNYLFSFYYLTIYSLKLIKLKQVPMYYLCTISYRSRHLLFVIGENSKSTK